MNKCSRCKMSFEPDKKKNGKLYKTCGSCRKNKKKVEVDAKELKVEPELKTVQEVDAKELKVEPELKTIQEEKKEPITLNPFNIKLSGEVVELTRNIIQGILLQIDEDTDILDCVGSDTVELDENLKCFTQNVSPEFSKFLYILKICWNVPNNEDEMPVIEYYCSFRNKKVLQAVLRCYWDIDENGEMLLEWE